MEGFGAGEVWGSEFRSVRPFPRFTAAPRKYGYAGSFPNCFARGGSGAGENGGRGRSLNFYSCADETAIFRSIKWALKLSGQFHWQNVLLFSSIPLSSASPHAGVTVFLTALFVVLAIDGKSHTPLYLRAVSFTNYVPIDATVAKFAPGRIPMCYR